MANGKPLFDKKWQERKEFGNGYLIGKQVTNWTIFKVQCF